MFSERRARLKVVLSSLLRDFRLFGWEDGLFMG